MDVQLESESSNIEHFVSNVLKKNNTKLLSLTLEATTDGVWAWHTQSGSAYFSPRYYSMLEYKPGDFPACYDSWVQLVHPDDLKNTQLTIERQLKDRKDSYEVEFRLRTKSGRWLWILGRGRVYERDDKGNPLLLVGSHVNIDKRKRAEKNLASYQEKLRQMVRDRTRELERTTSLLEATFDAIPDILGVQDHQHRMIRYNEAGYKLLGKKPEEIIGKRCFELIGRDRECDLCATSVCYKTKKPASVLRYEEAFGAWLDVRSYPILDEDGNIVRVIEHLRDVTSEKTAETEREQLQAQLLSAQKIESLGTLAGGIAHDFNNLLMGIQGRITLVSMETGQLSPIADHLKAIENYISSAANLTKQLLGYAQGGKYEVKPINLLDLVNQSSEMFGRTKKEIEIAVVPEEKRVVVEADKRQLEQVLLNLYINGWQAMESGGQLTIVVDITTLSHAQGKMYNISPGRYGRVTVSDTGIGMSEAVQQRIFDPFFTTKKKGRGTGLGLASAFGIVKNHGGMIFVTSKPGKGSSFSIVLPLSEKQPEKDQHSFSEVVKGLETILLIDDEEIILEVGKPLLESLGYKVITANGGAQGCLMIEEHNKVIDLVLLDMIMPGIDGEQVFDFIQSKFPHIPVLLSSGYAQDGQADTILKKGCSGFIQKPFSLSDLAGKIRTIFDSHSSR